MKCHRATAKQIELIESELTNSKEKLESGDFLDGFPWKSTTWFSCELNYTEIKRLFLFWDGIAWGKNGDIPPRRLDDGIAAFIKIWDDPNQGNNARLNCIKFWLKEYETSEMQDSNPFLILGGVEQVSPLLIIDGNHRVSAALIWAMKNRDRSKIPQKAWIGLSPKMVRYQYYWRIPQVQNR